MTRTRRFLLPGFLLPTAVLLTFCWGLAAAVTAAEPKNERGGDVRLVWDFESQLSAHDLVGAADIEPSGPNDTLFAGMPSVNNALTLKQPGAYLRVEDELDNGPLDFAQGDPITLEAWVRPESVRNGAHIYIVSKGRTYETSRDESHNYALRLSGAGNLAKVSFLFSTRTDDGKAQYHRWTSNKGFAVDGVWHHVAVSYQFGTPDSIQAVVDGVVSDGKWDMAGATELPPIADNDALWIGSSRGGAPGNSFVGQLDDIRIHRSIVPRGELISRREVTPYEPETLPEFVEGQVNVLLREGAGSHTDFPIILPDVSQRLTTTHLAVHRLPLKYAAGGIRDAWRGPVLLQAFTEVSLPPGEVELMIRSPGRARLWIDGEIVATTPARRLSPDAHQPFEVYQSDIPWLRAPRSGDHEVRFKYQATGGPQRLILESLVGSASTRCELGETLIAVRPGDGMFTVLRADKASHSSPLHLVDQEFEAYLRVLDSEIDAIDRQSLSRAAAEEDDYWTHRHQLAQDYISSLPGSGELGDKVPETIDRLLAEGAEPQAVAQVDQLTDDLEFLRRLSLDIKGVPPSREEIDVYLQTPSDVRREQAIARALADDSWADHWTSYWQDVLAENPNILKPTLNNTGPFRLWIHDALLINKPLDRFVTELISMRGDSQAGGAAGFGLAAQNDVPMAEKAHVIAGAFLGIDMKCARCHDAPYHPWKQEELFRIAAMLEQKPITVPETSSVPAAFFERRDDSPVEVTLQPGQKVDPAWPAQIVPADDLGQAIPLHDILPEGDGSLRQQLAALITKPDNRRFPQIMVNRLWTRLFGWGLVNDTDDWYEASFRNERLLDQLAREFVCTGYDLKRLTGAIVSSRSYQRRSIDDANTDRNMLHLAPWKRRMSAEQVVDSIHYVTGQPLQTEPITFDVEASQRYENFLNLGPAKRAWQLASMSNERDRPSLSLPKAAAVVECLEAFGWRASRQSPTTHREYEANMVQPGVVANGHMTGWATRLTDESSITDLALEASDTEELIAELFMSVLTRSPSEQELQGFVKLLQPGFEGREQADARRATSPPSHRGFVTWSNHFAVEANALMRDIEREVAAGPQPTQRLVADWRERAEDALWALVNAPEFQFIP